MSIILARRGDVAAARVVSVVGPGPNGTSIIDDFNRANANPPGGWTNCENQLSIFSNKLTPATGGGQSAEYTTTSYGPNCECFVTVDTKPTSDADAVGLIARGSTGSPARGYYLFAINKTGTDIFSLYRNVAGTYTQLGSNVSQEYSAGDKIGLSCVGTTIKGWLYTGGSWSVVITQTDGNITGAGFFGAYMNGTVARLDDFGGGNI